jgi:hypothetical protein
MAGDEFEVTAAQEKDYPAHLAVPRKGQAAARPETAGDTETGDADARPETAEARETESAGKVERTASAKRSTSQPKRTTARRRK